MLPSHSFPRRRQLPGGRAFHLLLAALAVSSCGDWLYNVALLAFVYERTRSGTLVALTTAARVAPIVALGPLGGVMADRYDRRMLMIASDLVRAAMMIALAVVAAFGLPILLAPALAAAATVAATVQPPCVAACTARLVPDHELQRANALRAAIGQAAVVAGPALGALVLIAFAPAIGILLNALTFMASAVAVSSIKSGPAFEPARASAEDEHGVLGDIAAGARALRGAPAAMRLIAADVLCSGVYGLLTVMLVVLSRKLGAGNGGYGLLLGAYGVGGLIGAGVTSRLSNPLRWRRTLTVALLLVAATTISLGALSTLSEALVAACLGGGGMVVGEVLSETALPRLLSGDVLGRAYGLALPASLGGIVAGSLVAGPLISMFGLQAALTAAGLFIALMAIVLLWRPLTVPTYSWCS
jgi:MFS family permease